MSTCGALVTTPVNEFPFLGKNTFLLKNHQREKELIFILCLGSYTEFSFLISKIKILSYPPFSSKIQCYAKVAGRGKITI